jgi:hypothetical protein
MNAARCAKLHSTCPPVCPCRWAIEVLTFEWVVMMPRLKYTEGPISTRGQTFALTILKNNDPSVKRDTFTTSRYSGYNKLKWHNDGCIFSALVLETARVGFFVPQEEVSHRSFECHSESNYIPIANFHMYNQ